MLIFCRSLACPVPNTFPLSSRKLTWFERRFREGDRRARGGQNVRVTWTCASDGRFWAATGRAGPIIYNGRVLQRSAMLTSRHIYMMAVEVVIKYHYLLLRAKKCGFCPDFSLEKMFKMLFNYLFLLCSCQNYVWSIFQTTIYIYIFILLTLFLFMILVIQWWLKNYTTFKTNIDECTKACVFCTF